uniref:NADH dehydrogenase [ubiquinone] 1 beta subcomplex subunit 6 n=1 Tax=Malurus cyaneus samueli TaxID=2593467 RepID=A0A8C5X906_9PASS
MSGSLGDEKLRVQQLRALRRRWLRDQELSPREPILPPQKLGPVAAFWEGFLKPGGLWRQQVSGGRRVPCDRILGEILPCEGGRPWHRVPRKLWLPWIPGSAKARLDWAGDPGFGR